MQLVHDVAHCTLHDSPWHSEITALCRLWLCAVAELDETNNRVDYSKSGNQSFIILELNPIYSVSQPPPQDFMTFFFANGWGFLVKFYMSIAYSCLHYTTTFYSIICNFDKVMPY